MLQIWVRLGQLWETVSLVLGAFLFLAAHWFQLDLLLSLGAVQLVPNFCEASQCFAEWVGDFWGLFLLGRKGEAIVFPRFSALKWLGSWPGWCQSHAKKNLGVCAGRMERRWISGTWQLDQLVLFHCHSQNNLKIRHNWVIKAHVIEQGTFMAATGSAKLCGNAFVLFSATVPFWA